MKKIYVILLLAFLSPVLTFAQSAPASEKVQKANYQLASRFSPEKLRKLIFSTSVNPNWLKNSDRFWYVYETPQGKFWYIVDPATRKKETLFNNADFAAQLTRIVKDPFDSQNIDIRNIRFNDDEQSFRFEVNSTKDTVKNQEERARLTNKSDTLKKKVFYLEYDLRSKKVVELSDTLKPKNNLPWANFSPDTSVIIFAKGFNLYWMDRENYEKARKNDKDSTIVEHQITKDGEHYYAWGGDVSNFTTGGTVDEVKQAMTQRRRANVLWSPSGKHFLVSRKDNRHISPMWVIHNVGSKRPTLETYKYLMPGEADSTEQELHLFEFNSLKSTQINVHAFKNQTLSMWSKSNPSNLRPDDLRFSIWHGNENEVFFARSSRDLKRIDILKLNVQTKEVKVLVEERMNTYQDVQRPWLIQDGKEFIHWSQRDGWGHYYLYDGEGNLKNQITAGEFYSSQITGVDEKTRTLYFIANGREVDEDPYYKHHYSVQFNGSALKVLNPGNFDHQISMSESNRFFVNNYSRVNTVPESVLYNAAGQKILDLEKSDLSLLFAAGYKFPEPYKVKADDGVTDLYGVMYKPFDFDSTKVYPLIQYVYPGPQTESVNKAFGRSMDRIDRLAQLGFIVVTVGNRGGHPERSKWYHNYGYGDLRDYGLADKKAAAEQLADRHSFIDINRVGITGHSGGGFMSTAALLVYPDFFKVAVSGAGNHENNIYNRWWSERHHGVREMVNAKGDTTFTYAIDRNTELAKNLKGNLLLVTGDVDNNVHPANTIRMAEALIKANKRFDFMLLPGQRHGFGNMSEYFFWMMGDYFAEHLLGDSKKDVDIMEINREIPLKK